MRMKKIVENRTLKAAAAEFFAFKRAQKIRERTLNDYQRYINPFVEQSSNSMDIDVLKREILVGFSRLSCESTATAALRGYQLPFGRHKVLVRCNVVFDRR